MGDTLLPAGVALITGAGSGIGQVTSKQFALRGCKKLFLVDVNTSGLERTKALIQEEVTDAQVTLCQTDITDEASVMRMVAQCVDTYGRVDFACNNAGIGTTNAKTADTTTAAYDKICDVNEKGTFFCEKHEIAQMLKQDPLRGTHEFQKQRGSIVNTASLCGIAVIATIGAYNSSKHAVVQMSAVDAREYAPDLIRINTVCPGFVETPMLRGSSLSDEYLNAVKAQCPANRILDPLEIANAILFLSGSLASGITGVNLSVDGGANLFHVI